MKSELMCATLMTVSLTLGGCGGTLFQRATPSCQIAPPGAELVAGCPLELAPQVPDSKGGTLLLNHQAAREAYDNCRLNNAGLIRWAQDVTTRCVAKPK